jgi:hypothetical protein
MARGLLEQAGFAGALLDTMLGIAWVECWHPILRQHFHDAVGDLGVISDVWGPSVGWLQVRSLRDPTSGNQADTWRVAEKLRDPVYSAQAARVIVGPDGENLRLWSPYKNQTQAYLDHIGDDFELVAGHPNAHLWNS